MVELNKWVFYALSGTSWIGTIALIMLYLAVTGVIKFG